MLFLDIYGQTSKLSNIGNPPISQAKWVGFQHQPCNTKNYEKIQTNPSEFDLHS